MEPKRIHLLFIVNTLLFGGAEKHVITLLNQIDTTRFRLTLAYLKNNDTLLSQLDASRLEGGVFCCNVGKKVDMAAARQLAQRISGDAVDIVVCTNTYSLLYGWLARFLSKSDPRLVELFHSSELGDVKQKIQMLMYRPLFLACDMLVYVCENQRKFWRRRALRAKQDAVIHNGIEVAHFVDSYDDAQKAALRQQYGFGGDDYVVGLCAAMRPEKAHADLLHAIAQMRAQGRSVKGLFIGDGPDRAKIEAQIAALGLRQHVKITGFIADVRPLIAACNVMALVSHKVETFSIAALEAMALGKPMIMTDTGGASELVMDGENGYLYPVGDIAALEHALARLMEPKKCAEMGLRARAVVVQKYPLGMMVERYENLLSEIGQGRVRNGI
jgi:glycosyltransferase involved in cell wall biosynthesis